MRNILFIFSLLFSPVCCFSQLISLQEIDFDRVPQKKIRHLIENQIENDIILINDVKGSSKALFDFNGFNEMENTFLIGESLETVWNKYLTVSPAQSWNGRIISFGLMLSKNTGSVTYQDDNVFDGVDISQVLYINLKLLGFYNLPVGFEVTEIDSINRILAFSYIEGGKVQGLQYLQFSKTVEGFTRIIHSSIFKSESHFRDRFLYPFFHERAITEFHRNIMEEMLLKNKTHPEKKNKEISIYGIRDN